MQLELVFCPNNFRVWVCVCVLPVNFRVGGSLERGRVRPAHEEPWHPAAATPARRGEGRGEGGASAAPEPSAAPQAAAAALAVATPRDYSSQQAPGPPARRS